MRHAGAACRRLGWGHASEERESGKREASARRSATIHVTERSIFFSLEKHNFGAFLKVAPALEQGILLHTKERLLQVYRQMRVPFFAELSDGKILAAAKHSVLEHYEPGQVVCRRGDEGATGLDAWRRAGGRQRGLGCVVWKRPTWNEIDFD